MTATERVALIRAAIARAEAETEQLRAAAATEVVTELETGHRSSRLLDIRHRRLALADNLEGLREALALAGETR